MLEGTLSRIIGGAVALGVVLMLLGQPSDKAAAQDAAQIARGKYNVVGPGGCGDCHTPGALSGKPDMTRELGGSDVGWAVPGLGGFVPPNLTPDKDTGLGNWTAAEIVTAFTKGKTPEGRVLAPAMPWEDFSHLSRSDALAVAAYLKTLKPVKHAVPGRFGPDQQVTGVSVMTVLPADVYDGLPKPAAQSAVPEKTP